MNIVRQVLKVLCMLCLSVVLSGCIPLTIVQWQKWQCEKAGGTVIDYKCHSLKTNGELNDGVYVKEKDGIK
jgi:hypothetical protein